MSRTKTTKPGGEKLSKSASKVSTDRVTKPADTPKAKSLKAAKDTAAKVVKEEKTTKKSRKEPTPPPASDSDSSSASSSSGSEASDSEPESAASNVADKPIAKPQKDAAKVNGATKAKTESVTNGAADSASSASSGSDDDSEESSSDSDAEPPAAKLATAAKTSKTAVANGTASSKEVPDEESSESDAGSESSSEGSEGSRSTSGESDSAESDSGDESDAESEADAGAEVDDVPVKKRKAESVEEPAQKKARVDNTSASGSKTLFIGNLSWNVDDDMLRGEFESFGEVVRANIMTMRDSGKSKGFGFVEFTTAEAAAEAHDAKKDQNLDGRPMNVDYTEGRGERGPANRQERTNSRAKQFSDQLGNPSNILFCGNLSFGMTSDKLREAFEEFGTVTRASLPTDRESGQPKGYGYVDFTSLDEAKAALEAMNGSQLDGRAVRLDYATPRADNGGGRSFSGGGRGRGDFGGRGGRGGGRGGRGGRGGDRGRGGFRGGRQASTNQGELIDIVDLRFGC